jgi:hypothetical protein
VTETQKSHSNDQHDNETFSCNVALLHPLLDVSATFGSRRLGRSTRQEPAEPAMHIGYAKQQGWKQCVHLFIHATDETIRNGFGIATPEKSRVWPTAASVSIMIMFAVETCRSGLVREK